MNYPNQLSLHIVLATWPLQSIVFKWRQNTPNTGFAAWSRIDTAWMRCATVAVGKPEQQVRKAFTPWQQATFNNRDHKNTLVVTISKYYQLFTSFTSIIRGNSPRSVHRDHSIIACLCHINMGVILCTHPVRGESHIQHKANRQVATPFWALSC